MTGEAGRLWQHPRAAAGLTALLCLGLALALKVTLPPDVALLGVLVGVTYTVLAVALSVTYRIGGVVNLALAMTALLGVVVLRTVLTFGLPWYVALVTGLVVALGLGALTEAVVVRRLVDAPRAVVVMATAALAVTLLPVTDLINNVRPDIVVATEDTPPGIPQVRVGDYIITPSTVLMLILLPLIIGTVTLVLVRTQLGIRVQATASDRMLARLGGVPAGRYVLAAWAIAAMLATLVLAIGPFSSDVSGVQTQYKTLGVSESLAPVFRQLVWPAVAAAVGRCRDVPAMLTTGISIAMFEQGLIWKDAQLGWLGVAVAVALVLSAYLQPPVGLRGERPGAWMAFRVGSRWPTAVRDLWWAVVLRRGLVVLGIAGFVALALGASPEGVVALAGWAGVTVLALAVFVETGLAGCLTFVHLPVAGAGAAVYVTMLAVTGAPALAVIAAVIVGLVLGCAVALVDRRAGGLTTLALTLVLTLTVGRWYRDFLTVYPVPGLPIVGGVPVSVRQMLIGIGALALIALLMARNLTHSPAGRSLVAQRDNALAVQAFGYSATGLRVKAGGIAGAAAGLGGCLIIAAWPQNDPKLFGASIAVALIFACILGGLTGPGGVLLGTTFVFAVPMLLPRSGLDLGVGLAGFVLVLLAPTGLMGIYERARDRALLAVHRRLMARRDSVDLTPEPPSSRGSDDVPSALVAPSSARHRPSPVARQVVLEAIGLTKSFGGVDAVRGLDLTVHEGEIVTLIGANGAGKTTTFDLLSGFLRPDAGTVRLFGADVTAIGPAGRSRLGLVRTFQDAALFPTLPLEHVIELACTDRPRRPALSGLFGIDPGRHGRRAKVHAALHRFGLEDFAETRVGELSTGTRRIAELAAASVLGARVLLLDEPSAGIAQREVEALAAALRRFRDEEGVTLLVIEHDIPLCRQISDRTIALGGGRQLASGTCDDVVAHPEVITAYLGTDPLGVERSGPLASTGEPR